MEFIKKNAKFLLFLLIIILASSFLEQCQSNNLKKKISALEKEKDSVEISVAFKNKEINMLSKILKSNRKEIDSVYKLKQQIKTERIVVEKKINSLSDKELDSIIKNTPKKVVVQSILERPLLLKEIDEADKLISIYKKSVKDYEKRDSLRIEVINDKDIIIANVEKQRDAYKKAARPKSGMFLYIEVPVNSSLSNPEIGLLYQVKNKLLIMGGVQYNKLTSSADINVGAGIKLF